MDGSVLPSLPPLGLHENRLNINAAEIVERWLVQLQNCFDTKTFDLSELFLEDGWWRDILGLGWDFTTKQGRTDIADYLSHSPTSFAEIKAAVGGLKPVLIEVAGMAWVQAGYSFRSAYGQGQGYLRLANVSESKWKAWTMFSQLERLGSLTQIEHNPDFGGGIPGDAPPGISGADRKPQVLIIGAGQAGVMLGARLQNMGLRTLLIDKNDRVGDSWRKRYKSLILNTPTFTDHYPYLRYPENWPRWLRRDQVATFMEHYTQLMGLQVRLKTSATRVTKNKNGFEVELQAPDGLETIHPEHVVLAAGVYSDEPVIPDIPGREQFRGQLYHSSQHLSAAEISNLADKRVLVIGASTSAHDVAQDFVNCGAKEVSLVQRHPIFSLSKKAWETFQLGLWNMDSITTEEADLVGNSLPIPVIRRMSIDLTKAMAEFDKDMIAGLKGAGLALRTGEDGFGLADHQLIKGGLYYIDHGANSLIIDGRIKIHHCEEGVASFGEKAVTLADGTVIGADVVVLATGFKRSICTIRKLLGDESADKLAGFGDLDQEQERAGWWRATEIPGFWYMTGSFLWCRQFSNPLALQIAAAIEQAGRT